MTDRACIDCGGPISSCSKGRCRACSAHRLNHDPAIVARQREALQEHYAKPGVRQAHAERLARYMANMPEHERERRREHGRRIAAVVLARPDVKAKANAPETKRKAGLARTETMLGWCPPELRDQYRALMRDNAIPAAEARRMIEEEITEKRRRAAQQARPPMTFERQLERVRQGARLVEKPNTYRRYDFTLGGNATGMI